jgi:hypothetical protein
MKVTRNVTPWSETLLAVALYRAHVIVCGTAPTRNRWKCAWGHLGLEQGRGRFTNNNNAGNITAGVDWKKTGDYFTLAVPPPDPASLDFRSLASAVDGCCGYWRLMLGRYARAQQRFDVGDIAGGCGVLSEMHYMLAALGPYARGVESCAGYADAKVLSGIPDYALVDEAPATCDATDCAGEMFSRLTDEQVLAVVQGINAESLKRQGEEEIDQARADRRRDEDG